jgi:hypothetical protein
MGGPRRCRLRAACAICGWWRRCTNRRAPGARWSAHEVGHRQRRDRARFRQCGARGRAAGIAALRDPQSGGGPRADVRRGGDAGGGAHRARGRGGDHGALARAVQEYGECGGVPARDGRGVSARGGVGASLEAARADRVRIPQAGRDGGHGAGVFERPSAGRGGGLAGRGGGAGARRWLDADDRAGADLLVRQRARDGGADRARGWRGAEDQLRSGECGVAGESRSAGRVRGGGAVDRQRALAIRLRVVSEYPDATFSGDAVLGQDVFTFSALVRPGAHRRNRRHRLRRFRRRRAQRLHQSEERRHGVRTRAAQQSERPVQRAVAGRRRI